MSRVYSQPPPDETVECSEPPEGFHVEWVLDPRSELCDGGKCRRQGCLRPAAFRFMRSNGWWRYCDWHTYGRQIREDGIYMRRLVADEDAS